MRLVNMYNVNPAALCVAVVHVAEGLYNLVSLLCYRERDGPSMQSGLPHKVAAAFSSLSSFTALDLRLAAHIADAGQGQVGQVEIGVKDLFTVDAVNVDTSMVEFIAHSRIEEALATIHHHQTPGNRHAGCALQKVPLCHEVVLLESRYTTWIAQTPELQVGDLGLGSVAMWHGTLDACLRGLEVVWQIDSGETVAQRRGSCQ